MSTSEERRLTVERDGYKAAWEAACEYIDLTPCDPDIFPDQWVAWQKFKAIRNAIKLTTPKEE